MEDWLFVGSNEYINVVGVVDIANVLTGQAILVKVDSIQKRESWNKAGAFIQILDLIPVSQKVEVPDSYLRVSFGSSLLKFQINSGNPYQLRFKPVPWLTCFTISIWQYLGD